MAEKTGREKTDKKSDGRAGEETRAALVAAGLKLFGTKGFDATSTREIAAEAGANIASIAYHFGGKEGLRFACAEMVAERLSAVVGGADLAADVAGDPDRAVAVLEKALSAFLGFIVGHPQAQPISTFVIGEIRRPGVVLDRLYGGVFEPVHRRLCNLLAIATGREPEDEAILLAAFTLAGQIIYFRIASPIVERRMGWSGVGPAEVEALRKAVLLNLHAFVAAHRREELK